MNQKEKCHHLKSLSMNIFKKFGYLSIKLYDSRVIFFEKDNKDCRCNNDVKKKKQKKISETLVSQKKTSETFLSQKKYFGKISEVDNFPFNLWNFIVCLFLLFRKIQKISEKFRYLLKIQNHMSIVLKKIQGISRNFKRHLYLFMNELIKRTSFDIDYLFKNDEDTPEEEPDLHIFVKIPEFPVPNHFFDDIPYASNIINNIYQKYNIDENISLSFIFDLFFSSFQNEDFSLLIFYMSILEKYIHVNSSFDNFFNEIYHHFSSMDSIFCSNTDLSHFDIENRLEESLQYIINFDSILTKIYSIDLDDSIIREDFQAFTQILHVLIENPQLLNITLQDKILQSTYHSFVYDVLFPIIQCQTQSLIYKFFPALFDIIHQSLSNQNFIMFLNMLFYENEYNQNTFISFFIICEKFSLSTMDQMTELLNFLSNFNWSPQNLFKLFFHFQVDRILMQKITIQDSFFIDILNHLEMLNYEQKLKLVIVCSDHFLPLFSFHNENDNEFSLYFFLIYDMFIEILSDNDQENVKMEIPIDSLLSMTTFISNNFQFLVHNLDLNELISVIDAIYDYPKYEQYLFPFHHFLHSFLENSIE